MPILDPDQQFYFAYKKEKQAKTSQYSFFLKFLPLASKYLRLNLLTLQSYAVFREDFLNSIDFLNKKYGLSIPSKEKLEKKQIDDYFYFFYEQLSQKTESSVLEGEYYKIDSKTSLHFFEPFIDFSESHRWYFTDSSFAILALNSTSAKNFEYFSLSIILEADILKSIGLNLVLCVYIKYCSQKCLFILDLIKKGLFSEIHFNLDHNSSRDISSYNNTINGINNLFSPTQNENDLFLNYYNFYGYFYLYISYTPAIRDSIKKLKPLKQNPYYHRFFYSASLIECFTTPIQIKEKFLYCESGFKNESIRINLCQVPLYEGKYEDQYNSPCELSKIECVYVRSIDFLKWKSTRVEVLFDDYSSKYVDFNDLHVMKHTLYINNMLLTMKESEGCQTIIDSIQNGAFNTYHTNKETFKKQTIHLSWSEESVIKKNLTYLFHAALSLGITKGKKFEIRQNQIFSIYESCISCLFNDKQSRKGVIYQVETGEGKSLIIQLIAALLALTNKSVHIATSNIKLAKRDFVEIYGFYEKLGIKSAIMLHQNELIEDSDKKEVLQNIYNNQTQYYGEECFKNSLNMNLNVSGFKKGEMSISNDIKIVFSTVVHFEALYLKMMEIRGDQSVVNYFKERSLIIDEADVILIDDIENGTILSRPISSNSDEILTFVYQCKMGKLDIKNFERLAYYFIPTFKDIKNLKNLFKSYDTLPINRKAECNKEEIITGEQISNVACILDLTLAAKFGIFSSTQLSNFLYAVWPNHYKKNKIEMKKHYITDDIEKKELMNNSNCFNFLTFICQTKIGNLNPNHILQMVQKFWPENVDLQTRDIESMFEEIDKVHSDLFFDGCRYKISKVINEKGKKQKNRKFAKAVDTLNIVVHYDDYLAGKLVQDSNKEDKEEDKKEEKKKEEKKKEEKKKEEDKKEEKKKDKKKKERNKKDNDTENGSFNVTKLGSDSDSNDSSSDSDSDLDSDSEQNINIEDLRESYEIIPFDYDNKGIIEKNKEFGGFIQQFIAIKERINMKDKIKKFRQELNNLKNALNDIKQMEDFKQNRQQMTDFFEDLEQLREIEPNQNKFNKLIDNPKEMKAFLNSKDKIKDIIYSQKEKLNIKIKDMAINYLYVSHPIFVQLYKNVCGFTGTIGNKSDKTIFKDYYKLDTLKIPRNTPNKCVTLPITICKDYEERNQKILDEILYFHLHKKPVLVILQDLTEIYAIKRLLQSKNITNFNVFDGVKFENPEKSAGFDGAISLGSNFCGRGTNIKCEGNPLHVIVSYYSSNVRVIYQAYGRTARNDHEGTCRIICVKDQFFNPIEILTNDDIEKEIKKVRSKSNFQSEFINYFREKLPWLFSPLDINIKVSKEIAQKLEKTHLNVNRIRAYTYKYPICMTVDSYLDIQSQKIFSLYNCPNCKYTWRIFKRYVREMILQSWILNLDYVENYGFEEAKKDRFLNRYEYEDYLKYKIDQVQSKIVKYLIPTNNSENDILSVFMNIHKKVESKWYKEVHKFFKAPFKIPQPNFKNYFVSLNFGFIPYTLYDESGVKVDGFDGDSVNNFIKDPELSYYRKKEGNFFERVQASITEKIDDIFEQICQKVNDFIGGFTGLRFFLRRTIAGCEFGICLDLNVTLKDEETIDPRCMIDTDPLFVFTIHTKSEVFVLAAILIIVLVYVGSICFKVLTSIESAIKVILKKGFKLALYGAIKAIKNSAFSGQIGMLFNTVINCLRNCLISQISNLEKFDVGLSATFSDLVGVITRNEYDKIIDKLLEKIGAAFARKKMAGAVISEIFPYVFKIGLLIFLCITAFFMNFNCRKKQLKNNRNDRKLKKETDFEVVSHDYEVSVDKKKSVKEVQESKERLKTYENAITQIASFD